MRYRRVLGVIVALLLAASPAGAHRSVSPQCYTAPPPRNSEGPPEVDGFWEEIVDLGQQAIHAIHLPTGKLLIWGYNAGGLGLSPGKLYDPESGVITDIALPTPSFCAGHTHLADGTVIIAGGLGRIGSTSSVTFNPFTETFGPLVPLYAGRYYPTLTTLADGRVFTGSGTGSRSSTPEIYDPTTSTWTPLGCQPGTTICRGARLRQHFYARTSQTPDGRLFAVPASRPLWAHTFDFDTETWMRHTIGTGPAGKMTPAPAVYYAPGKMLRAGADVYANFTAATADASVVEFADSLNPTYRTIAPMAYARNRNSLTILADGTVLTTGGIRNAPCTGTNIDPHVYHPELWDPATEQWETLGPMQQNRVYHSTALLLRDGSIIVAGGEAKQKTAQIFHPPYLFKGPRPVITAAPATIDVEQPFEVFTPDAASVSQVNLLQLGAATHAYDENQRIVRLPFVAGVGKLTVDGPVSNYEAPPGYYMLFLISDLGVPSVSQYVQVELYNPYGG
jgi:hypothetical protein